MKNFKLTIGVLLMVSAALGACSKKNKKDANNGQSPVVVGPAPAPGQPQDPNQKPSKPGSKPNPFEDGRPGQGSQAKPGRRPIYGQEPDQSGGQYPTQNQNYSDTPQTLESEVSNFKLEWRSAQIATEWIGYIFSDRPASVRSQIAKEGVTVEVRVRSVGINDTKGENYAVALLSFHSGKSFVRDFEVRSQVTVKNIRSSDRFLARLVDSDTKKKIFGLRLERKKVSRLDPNGAELIQNMPWSGVLFAPQEKSDLILADVSGTFGTLTEEEAESILEKH